MSPALTGPHGFPETKAGTDSLRPSGGGHGHAAVAAGVPPEPLPPPHLGQRLPEHQAAPGRVHVRREPGSAASEGQQAPLEEHHPRRVRLTWPIRPEPSVRFTAQIFHQFLETLDAIRHLDRLIF